MRLRRLFDQLNSRPLSNDAARVAYSGFYGGYLTEYRGVALLRNPCDPDDPKKLMIKRSGGNRPWRNAYNPAEQHHLKSLADRQEVYDELNAPGVSSQVIQTERRARRAKRIIVLALAGIITYTGCGSTENEEPYDCPDETTAFQAPSEVYACESLRSIDEG